MIKQFDNQNLNAIRQKLTDAMIPLAAEFGISINVGRCSYNSNLATFKLECGAVGDNGVAVTKEAEAYRLHHWQFGLPEDGMNKTVRIRGDDYVIIGLAPRRSKYPVLATKGGKRVCLPAAIVNFSLKTASA